MSLRINLMCGISRLGYGQVGLHVLLGLVKTGIHVSYFPMGGKEHIEAPKECHNIIVQALQNSDTFSRQDTCLKIWHQHYMAESVGRVAVGWPIFELNRFTERETYHLNSLDAIIVCSVWAAKVLQDLDIANGRVHIVPLGVNTDTFKPKDRVGGDTIFLNVGKWEIRKGHDVLVKAFNQAFQPTDNVRLCMMCTNPFYSDKQNSEWEKFYKQSKMGDHIDILPPVGSSEDVARVMQNVDCGVFPSRAEGWNLELLEMMACGKALIATDYSGHTEFVSNAVYLIPQYSLEEAIDGIWFHGQGQWMYFGEEEMDYLVEHLRQVHKIKQTDGSVFSPHNVDYAQCFTWDNTIKDLVDTLQIIKGL